MAITAGITNTAKLNFMKGVHLTTNTYKIALYTSSATLAPTSTTAYTTSNEVTGTGYTAGGATLTSLSQVLSGNVATMDFADPSWASSSITARGALIYDSTAAGTPAILIIDFGADITSTSATFTIIFPAVSSTTALIRLG